MFGQRKWDGMYIRHLEKDKERADAEKALLEQRIEELEKKLRGERVCDGYCSECKNSYVNPGIGEPNYGCLLDCKCKDFARECEPGDFMRTALLAIKEKQEAEGAKDEDQHTGD